MSGKWSLVSLSFLFVIALAGTLLRLMPLAALPQQYDHVLHAHSHTAFQGWVYTVLFLLMCRFYLSADQVVKGRYLLQFQATALVVAGVLITFFMQGYGLYSILFSTLFQGLNYWFFVQFFKDTRSHPSTVSLRFVKTGLWLGVLSTIAPFAIGYFSARGMSGSEPYHAAVYFFLHFQYNGWFQFVALGLFLRWLELDAQEYDTRQAKRLYQRFLIAVVPAYTLALLDMRLGWFFWWLAAPAALLQVLGLVAFVGLIRPLLNTWLNRKSLPVRVFLWVALLSFLLKYLLQFVAVLPAFKETVFSTRNLIIGYLHLCLLGVFSAFFIALFFELGWVAERFWARVGAFLFLLGFVITEFLLGLSGWYYLPLVAPMLFLSALMALGIGLLLMAGAHTWHFPGHVSKRRL